MFEPFASIADLILGGSGLSVYRASLSRTLGLVVAPPFAPTAASANARVSRVADMWSEDDPAVRARRSTGRLIADHRDSRNQMLDFRWQGEDRTRGFDRTLAMAVGRNPTAPAGPARKAE